MTLGIGAAALASAGVAVADDADGNSTASSSSTSSVSVKHDRDREASRLSSRRDEAKARRQERRAARVAARDDARGGSGMAEDIAAGERAEDPAAGEQPAPADDGATDPVDFIAAVTPLSSAVRRDVEPAAVDLPASTTAAVTGSAAATASARVAATVKLGSYFPESVAASPDGRYVYAGTGTMNAASGSVVVIDSATNTVKKTITTDFVVTGLAVAPNGTVYAAGFDTIGELSTLGVVAVINPARLKVTKTITLGKNTAYSLPIAVTPDGKSVVVGWGTPVSYGVGYAGTVTTISTATLRVTNNVYFRGSVSDLAITPDSKTAVVTVVDSYPASMLKIDLATGSTTAIDLSFASNPVSVTVTPGGVFALVAYEGGSDDIAIVHLSSGEVLEKFSAGYFDAEKIRLSADGRTLFAIEDNALYTVDVQSRSTVNTLTIGPGVHYWSADIALGPRGAVYLATLYDSSITVVSTSAPNTKPTVTVEVGDPSGRTGAVKGSIVVTDSDGTHLSYSVSAPAKGTFKLGRSGVFTYTPSPAARHAASAAAAGVDLKTDTFNVTASNAQGATVTVPVSVSVLPNNKAPTLRATVGKPDSTTSVVTITLKAADRDNDALTYSMPAQTAHGALVRNDNGTLTFTPNLTAGMPSGKDTFTVTADDGHGGITNISITVVAKAPSLSAHLKKWVDTTHGTQVGDGQCVALVKAYLAEFYGLNADGWGDAVNYARGRGRGGAELDAQHFSWHTDTKFQDGDIIVYQQGGWNTSPAGHIGIWYQGQLYDQNSGWHPTFDSGVPVEHAGFSPFWNKDNRPPYRPNGKVPDGYLGYWRK